MLIGCSKELKELCSKIRKNSDGSIGIDTEFIRKHNYHPRLCLIQVSFIDNVSGTHKNFLVDVLDENMNLEPFLRLLRSRKIKKIMHSFSQDMDALRFFTKSDINNVEDTQIMAEFCGYKNDIGYASAVNLILNIEFLKNKNIQVSHWEKRPLSSKQLVYAHSDVEYLLPLYSVLSGKIREIGNYEFYRDEIKHIQNIKQMEYVAENSWKKLRLRLHRKTMNYVLLMKELSKWREFKAMEVDKIRNYILDDNSLENIVAKKPKTIGEFKTLYSHRKILNLKKTYKNEIIEIIKNFRDEEEFAGQLYYANEVGFQYREILDGLYSEIIEISNSTHIYITRIINKTDLIALLMGYEDKKNIVYGWKKTLLGELLADIEHLVER
jgi:ribonuclease D